MSEPQRTEPIASSLIYEDRSRQPFVIDPKTYVSLGPFKDRYSVIRRKLFKRIAETVSPVLPKFERIGIDHGRSMTEIASSKNTVWGGPFPSDIFGARSVKGSRMNLGDERRRIQSWDTTYNLAGFGLMDDACIGRVIKASEFMRKNGLPTERPVAVKKLKEIFVVDESGNWVRTPIKRWEEDELKKIRENPSGLKPDEVEKYLDETDFIVLERDVQLDERLRDLKDAILENRLKEFIEPVFRWLNVVCQTKNSGVIPGTQNPGTFSYTKEGLVKYFQNFLPSQMGTFLGRFHKLGLKHGYATIQNWSVVGTLYDLDSVGGKVLFSKDATPGDLALVSDIEWSDATLESSYYHLKKLKEFDNNEALEIRGQAIKIFLKSYFAEKYGPDFRPGQINREELNYLRRNNYSLDEIAAVSI